MPAVRLILLAASAWLLSACSEKKQEADGGFAPAVFFAAEAGRLGALHASLTKNNRFGNKEETLVINDPVNWKEELQPFAAIDFHARDYHADTTGQAGNILVIYRPKEDRLEVKEMKIGYDNGRVNLVQVVRETNNSLYHVSELLRYKADSGYRITGNQKINYLDETRYAVGARWRN